MRNYFIDCGTHFGEGLSFFVQHLNIDNNWKIYSFEANPSTYKVFIDQNKKQFDHLDCKFVNKAVNNYDGKIIFNRETPKGYPSEFKMGGGSSIMPISEWNPWGTFTESYDDSVEVDCFDLSSFVNNITDYDKIYMKLDIEGAEFNVLEKMIKEETIKKIKCLWVEFHDTFFNNASPYTNRKHKIINFLQNNDIKLYEWH